MNLKRLAIHRLPGIREPFEIEAERQGIHIVFGPNGIGKSSICRAIESLYWEDRGPSRQTLVAGDFESGGETWRAEREGSIVRWSRGDAEKRSPYLPASHNYYCFFLHLRDLIDTAADGTADIALEIQRQLSGGFDLGKIVSDLFVPVTHRSKRTERNSFNRASEAVRLADTNQSRLQKQVDQLEQLQSSLNDAETAAGRHLNVDRAIGLAKRREELAAIEEQLGKLPSALAKLTGNECDDVNRRQAQLAKLKEQTRELERDLQNARRKIKVSALSAPLEQADLVTWRDNADELGRIDQALEAARNERERARKRVDSALSAIGGSDADTTGLSLPDHNRLFEFLRASQAHRTRDHAIRERLRLLSGPESFDEEQREMERLRTAADALRSWLRLPEPEAARTRLRRRLPWLLPAFVLLSAGAVLAFAIDPALAPIAALGAGIGLAALFLGSGPGASRRRQAAQATYENLDQEEPSDWAVPSVESALRNLERNVATLEASLQRQRVQGEQRWALESELKGLADQQDSLNAQRRELQAALGLEALRPDAELVDFARALDELRSARAEYRATAGSVQRHEKNYNDRLGQLTHVLQQYGEPGPDGTAAAKARLNNLADRNARLETALASERTVSGQLTQISTDRKERLAAIGSIFVHADLTHGDLNGLRSLIEDLPKYRELEKERRDLESKIDLDRGELKKAGEAGLADMNVQALEQLKSKLEHARSQAEGLRQQITDVKTQLNQARQGSDLQDLIAAREGARASLEELRDKALFAAAGDFLIEEIEQEYEQTRMPRVFERARQRFSEFTRHNYELRLEKGNGKPRLIATDLRDRQRRGLDELSDGTRAQLLLAARIAFAEEVERGEVLPLFFDEALDQSDPQRFRATVQSLGCIARDQGRQIFYLTSDPLDVDRIRDALGNEDCEVAAAIDLGLIRTGAASVSGPETLAFKSPAPVPMPGGLSSAEYGALLGVPALSPSRGFAEQHMFYVLSDNLDLLRDLLTNGIERAGQWRTVADTSLATRLGAKSVTAEEIGLRVDLLEVFCELWKQGRGKPVDRDALLDSDALTPRFCDDVAAIARELDGNPERLIDELTKRRDSRLRGFQSRNTERLERYLSEHGYIDERPTLTGNELQLRALASPAAISLTDGVAIDCIQRWWGWAERSSLPETAKQAK